MTRKILDLRLALLNSKSKLHYTVYSSCGMHSLCIQTNKSGGVTTVAHTRTMNEMSEIINAILNHIYYIENTNEGGYSR